MTFSQYAPEGIIRMALRNNRPRLNEHRLREDARVAATLTAPKRHFRITPRNGHWEGRVGMSQKCQDAALNSSKFRVGRLIRPRFP